MELGPLQKKWIELLKSGKYKQTTEWLHLRKSYPEAEARPPEDAYCCLGIACRFVLEQEPELFEVESTNMVGLAYNALRSTLSNYADLGLRSPGGSADRSFHIASLIRVMPRIPASCARIKVAPSLTDLNDTYSFTFSEIADVLLVFPEVYFTRSV